LWYFFTAILAVVILFFGYSMMIILRQKRLSEVQRDFINNMSHEFRTPLTSIGLASDVLGDEGNGGDAERFSKYAVILKDQIHLLQKKVDKILQQAETEHKFFKLNKERINLTEFLKETIDEFNPAAEHRNGRLELEIHAIHPDILADRYHLSGILINLIDNSLKYTENPPVVQFTLTENTQKLYLKLQDTGTGIDKQYIRKVFMPFFRVPSGNIHNVKGSGLGLSYVKRICDLHGWKIKIESEPGKGTAITLTIPKAE
jgi:two-component system, OmpR family, phosphate regulon sensor histidine kinase PhoR